MSVLVLPMNSLNFRFVGSPTRQSACSGIGSTCGISARCSLGAPVLVKSTVVHGAGIVAPFQTSRRLDQSVSVYLARAAPGCALKGAENGREQQDSRMSRCLRLITFDAEA